MQLLPKRQPGRSDRKAAAYVAEIVRLREAGYTFEAIREALADVGIELTTSALRREVRRPQRIEDASNRTKVPRPTPTDEACARFSTPSVLNTPPAVHRSNGHEIAEAFFIAHPSNPLLRAKERL